MKRFVVTYWNEGKPERAEYETEEEAREGADFLRFQGATHVRIRDMDKARVIPRPTPRNMT